MTEKLVVIGAGIAGLCVALSMAPSGRQIVLLEKDLAPPEGGADEVFFHWRRRGASQWRHSHAFLARLRDIIRRRHPALLDRLLAAGCRELGFIDMLPDTLRETYVPQDGDDDLVVLTSRRSTLEWVMRGYVETLANVTIQSDATVRDLIIQTLDGGRLSVLGVRCDHAGVAREWLADLTIDASGRGSQTAGQLIRAGAAITEVIEDCGILYYTRHYRILPGVAEPTQGKALGTGDLGFIKFGLFPGDNNCFSVTLAVPEIEMEMRQHIVHPDMFDQVCSLLPGLAPWTGADRAQPVSKVFGMGDLRSCYRSFVADDQRATLGFFAVGDSLVRTNPLYGRGCSFAAVEAEILAGALAQTADPAARARLYDARVKEELTPYYDTMRDQDRAAIRRARNALKPADTPRLAATVVQSFFDDGVRVAMRSEVEVFRAALRDFHMLEPSGRWLRQPTNAFKVVKWWARGKHRNADLHPPPAGPGRAEMMAALGLDADADPRRVNRAA